MQMAMAKFNSVSPGEETLCDAVEDGIEADCTNLPEADKIIRSDLLAWLCKDPVASLQVKNRGISIIGAKIDGKVDLTWSKVSFPLRTRKCAFTGSIYLGNSHLDCLELTETSLKGIEAAGVIIDRGICLCTGFVAEQKVNLYRAKVGGDLVCSGGSFNNTGTPDKRALDATGANIEGFVFLSGGFKACGEVRLVSANIGGDLDCSGGDFRTEGDKPAINANGAKIGGFVFFRYDPENGKHFKAAGEVRLRNATVGKNLECDGAQFEHSGVAVEAPNLRVEGGVFFRAADTIDGYVKWMNAKGQINLAYSRIEQLLWLEKIHWGKDSKPKEVLLNLEFTRIGTLRNHEDGWPPSGRVRLEGLTYESIHHAACPEAPVQLKWIRLQSSDRFSSQPYQQLAAVFRKSGLEKDERKVLVEKNKDYAKYVHWRPAWLWYGFLGKSIGYGYHPWRALGISLVFIVIGSGLFYWGYNAKIITPTEKEAYTTYVDKNGRGDHFERYPAFYPIVYSTETFVPLLKLGLRDYWTPNSSYSVPVNLIVTACPIGGFHLLVYLWIHITAGWVLTTLWVGGFSGLVKT
jgi:hypothetical protein